MGFDLASNPMLLEALNKSRDTGQTVATPGMALDRVSGYEFGFLVFTPIYRNGFPADTLAQRRENLAGFALAVFQINELLNHSLSLFNVQNGESGLEVQLYDRSAPPEQQLLFSGGHTESAAIGSGAGQSPSGLSTAKTFKVADRTWELILISPSPRLSLWSIWQAWAVSAGGLLFTLLLTNYLLASVRRTAAVERLVAARTMELSQSNQRLEEEVGERKRAEEELRRSNDQNRGLLEAIPDMMFRLNQNGEILEYKAAKGVELYAPLETFMGKRIDDVLPEDIADSCISYAREGLQAGEVRAFEYQLLIGENSRGFEARAAASGQNEVLLIVRDITERLVVDRMKDEFISVVSHELRTLLTSIRGSLGLMAGGVLGPIPEKAQKMVLIALSNADRLSRLINDILDLERIHSGSVTMDKTECDTAALMGQAAEVMGDIAEEAGVNLSVSHDSLQIWADPDRMIQTFTNLLGNAIKFSPPGGFVSLAAQILEDQVLFQVKDQGRGIPAANLANIFERFQQVDASDSREKGGTGLGLAICRSIVLQHGGRIWAESNVGEGSTFNVTLPQRQEYPDMRITTNKGDAATYGC